MNTDKGSSDSSAPTVIKNTEDGVTNTTTLPKSTPTIHSNFLTAFVEFASGTEAPENYHIWSAIGTMSAILQGRIWLPYGRFKVLPNTYIVLLGPPGNGKTTSMSFGLKVVREIPEIVLSATAQTKESLVKELVANQRAVGYGDVQIPYAPMALFLTELSHFLGPNSGHMIDFLTTVYDQDRYDNKTKNKGNETILGPYVSMLACTTPDWVSTYLKTDIITGGFTRRAIFVNESEGQTRVDWPEYTETQLHAFAECVRLGKTKKDLVGEMHWTDEARAWFRNWYQTRVLPKDPTIRGFARTRHMQMLKVAMILSVCESNDLVLTEAHLQMADLILSRVEPMMSAVFNAVGRNELHAVGEKIKDIVRMHGGIIQEKQVLQAMSAHATTREIYEVIDYLGKTDQVRRTTATLKNGVKANVLVSAERFAEEQAKAQARTAENVAKAFLQQPLPPDPEKPSGAVEASGQSSVPVSSPPA